MRITPGLATIVLALAAPAMARAQAAPPSSSTAAGAVAPTPTSAPAPIDVQQVAVPGTSVRAGRVATEVDAPFDVVAAVLTDFAHYSEFLPQVDTSRVVQRRRGQVDVYLQARLLNNLGTIWALGRFTVRRAPGSLVVEGGAVQGNMARFDVRFEATAVPNSSRTRVVMQLLGIPALPFPEWLLTSQQARWAALGLDALRARAERAAAQSAQAPQPGARVERVSGSTQAPTGGGPGRR
jgi:hypothetical protein